MASRQERRDIGRRRLVNILSRHTVAVGRTLEQKIADAGPYGQRVDPHILTEARGELIKERRIVRVLRRGTPWFHLDDASPSSVKRRLEEQEPIHRAVIRQQFTKRVGQAAEIAVYRAFRSQNTLELVGRFLDLDDHDDSQLYHKEEPPGGIVGIGGREIPDGRKLDFLARHPKAGWAAIEVKNMREWLYPDRDEVKDLLQKSLYLNAIPVLIGRPYVTRRVLASCGVIVWETYNQLYPETDAKLARQASHKQLLGYHDIRLGNRPSPHLNHFIAEILPEELPDARESFDRYRDLLEAFVFQGMHYDEFAGRARRREQGTNEDHDLNRP